MAEPTARLPKWKYVTFALTTVILSTLLTATAILGLDIYLHKRYEKRWGLNVWGYRGPAMAPKRPGEARIVVVGGSTALGFGLPPDQSFPAYLERGLTTSRQPPFPAAISVVNLAYNNEGAYSFKHTLRDYAYLGYDIAVLYTGVNDLAGPNTQVFRHESGVFRLTGYYLMLPSFLRERALYIRYGGDLDAAARGEKTVFTPKLGERTSAAALDAAARVSRSLERQLARFAQEPPPATAAGDLECGARWNFYCRGVFEAVDQTLGSGRKVMVVSEPYVVAFQAEQQTAMVRMLGRQFGRRPDLCHVDLGHAVDVRDAELAVDGMHLTATGNAQIAARLADTVRWFAWHDAAARARSACSDLREY